MSDVLGLPHLISIRAVGKNDQMFKIFREYSWVEKEKEKLGRAIALNEEEIEKNI